ncbi:substrate-binding domain-containing protein [Agrobacterium pusense]|uniref:substrate-binding domain-containing protein n=1 Tax=Agrobacterium pusense TaxID=648995 RepID=UPI003FD5438D
MMTKRVGKQLALTAIASLIATLTVVSAEAKDEITIGVAMPFQGNSWQKGFLAAAQWAAGELSKDGKTVKLNVVDAAGDAQTQAQQLNNMTLQGVDFIILEPLSDTALNGAIDNAVGAGIPVLTTALGSVTNAKAIDLQFDYDELGEKYVSYIAQRTGGKGNALNIRGLAGNAAEQAIQDGYIKALAKYPDIKIVSEVYGDWNQSVAQQRVSAILPTLPKIDIIFSQGVAAFGAAQAFLADGRDVPLQVYGFDGTDVNLLLDLNSKSGYESAAINVDPGIGSLAVNVAVAKVEGVNVPMKMTAPIPTITLDDLKTKYAGMADSDIVWVKYAYDWTLTNVIGAQ